MNDLPRLYVIGDSISIDYGPYLQHTLQGHVRYARKTAREEALLHLSHSLGDSGGDSLAILSFLKARLNYERLEADYILLNCGLHDIKTNAENGPRQVPLHDYKLNLREIIKIIQQHRICPIWIRTTLFDEHRHNTINPGFYRYESDCKAYNDAADQIMRENNIPVIDLCAFNLTLGPDIYCDHVHFRENVRKKQASYIADQLLSILKRPRLAQCHHNTDKRLNNRPHSVSIVICCYNSAKRLPDTLKHIATQDVPPDLLWEVIVIDNASTDGTAQIAKSLWPENSPAPLRIIPEPLPGLNNARKRGIKSARYDLICFVDDDNWLEPNWVRLVSQIMTAHPEVGACGGKSDAVFEKQAPWWFTHHANSFAVGEQGDKTGDVTWSRGNLWGAGLTIRKKAWLQLTDSGFQPTLMGRTANILTSGEDYELCYALRLACWRLWYTDKLVLKHNIPTNRLSFSYLRRLNIGFGAQSIHFDPYRFYVHFKPSQIKSLFGHIWIRQLLLSVFIALFRDRSFWNRWMGNYRNTFNHRIKWAYHWGRIKALWKERDNYDRSLIIFHHFPWIRIDRDTAIFLNKHPEFGDAGRLKLSDDPLVSILICNYNYGRYLARAIDSALSQTWKNIEVIVVDDGSTDESAKVLNQYEGRITIIFKENGGQASAFNAGVLRAHGEIICFLDSDDFCYPQRVEHIVSKYREAAWGLICHHLHEVDAHEHPIRNLTHAQITNSTLMSCNLEELLHEHDLAWVFSPTSGMNLPAELAKKIFPIPEDKWRICADSPLAVASICHAPVGVIDEALGAYRLHDLNAFASARDDRIEMQIHHIRINAELFFFLNHYLEKMNRGPLDWNPKMIYSYYRSCCFIARKIPAHDLINLWKLNIHNYLNRSKSSNNSWFHHLKYLIMDAILVTLIALNLSHPYRYVRKRYTEMSLHFDPLIKNYIETDG